MHHTTALTTLLLGLLGAARAHTVVRNGFINGKSPGLGVCLRLPKVGWDNSPVKPTSQNMACGIDGSIGALRTCPVKAGDTITFDYYHEASEQYPEPYLSDGHNGPCSFMMKKVDSAVKDGATGDGWFRIAYEGYNNQTGKWCSQRVQEEGFLSVVLPTDLPGGDYLLRSEVLALHSAISQKDPQFYVACMQIFLDSAGSGKPQHTVALPSEAYVSVNDKALNWNLYDGKDLPQNYPGYGPPTYVSSSPVDPNAKFQGTQTDGLRPTNCILEVRNFCHTPEPQYTNMDGCWKANENCWKQHETCYKSGPIGDGCQPWAARCKARESQCNGPNPTGPETKDLTPPAPTCNPPAPFDAGSGDSIQKQAQPGSQSSSTTSDGSYASASTYSSSGSSAEATTAAVETSAVAAAGSETTSATTSATETTSADYSAPSLDSKVEGGDSFSPDSGSSSAVTSAQAAPTADGQTCASVITDTVTEVVTVTATTTATVNAESSGKAEATGNGNGYGYGHGYRRMRRV